MAPPAAQQQPGAIARQRQIPFLWWAEAVLAEVVVWGLYVWNYRLIWGWYFYCLEYIRAFSNLSTTTVRECRLMMQELNLWSRVSWNPYWWFRKRCEGALYGRLGRRDFLAQAFGFMAGLVTKLFTKVVDAAWHEAPHQIFLSSLALVKSCWSCAGTVVKSTVDIFYALGQGIRSFELPTSKILICISDKRQCGPFVAWLASRQFIIPAFMLLVPYLIYRQFGKDGIIEGLTKFIDASSKLLEHFRIRAHEVYGPVIGTAAGVYHVLDHVWQSLPFTFCDASKPFWKHPLLIAFILAEVVFLARFKDSIGTVLKIAIFSMSAWLFIFPQHLHNVLGYPYELISILLAKGDRKDAADETRDEGEELEEEDPISRLLANIPLTICLVVFVYLSHQLLGAIATTIPETSSLVINIWTCFLHIGFGYTLVTIYNDDAPNQILPIEFLPRVLVLNLYSCTFSAFVTFVANAAGIRFLGNTWQYWAPSTQSSTLTTYTTFFEVYIIFLLLVLTALFSIRFTFVVLYWVTTILVFLTGDVVFTSLLPSIMFDKYTQNLKVPFGYSWGANTRACIILGFLIYARSGVSAFLLLLSILTQNWTELALVMIYFIILHTLLAHWLKYPTILDKSPPTIVEWGEIIYSTTIVLAQVLFTARAIDLLRGLFAYLEVPVQLSFGTFVIYIIFATYLAIPAFAVEEKLTNIPEFLYFVVDESMALLTILLLPQAERTIFGTGVFDNPFNNDFVQDNSYGNGLIAMGVASFLYIIPLLIYFALRQGIFTVEFTICFVRNLVGWEGLLLTGSRYFLLLLPVEYQAWLTGVLPEYARGRSGSPPAQRRFPSFSQPRRPPGVPDDTPDIRSSNRLSSKSLTLKVWQAIPHFWRSLYTTIWRMYFFSRVLQYCFSKPTADFLFNAHIVLVFTDYWDALSHSKYVTEVAIGPALAWAALIVLFRSTIETHIQSITVERYFQIMDNASGKSLLTAGILLEICLFIIVVNGKTMFNFWYRLQSVIYLITKVTLDVLLTLRPPSLVRWLGLQPKGEFKKMYVPDNVEIVIRDYSSKKGNVPVIKGLTFQIMIRNIVWCQVLYPGFWALDLAFVMSIIWDFVFQNERIYFWYGLCERLFPDPESDDDDDDDEEDEDEEEEEDDDEDDDEDDYGDDDDDEDDEDEDGDDDDGLPPSSYHRPPSEVLGPTTVGSNSVASSSPWVLSHPSTPRDSSGFPTFEGENLYDAETPPRSPKTPKSPLQTGPSLAPSYLPTIRGQSESNVSKEQPRKVSSLSGNEAMKAKLGWIRANRSQTLPPEPKDAGPAQAASPKKKIIFDTPTYASNPRTKRPESLRNASVEDWFETPPTSPAQISPNSPMSPKTKK